VRAPSGEKVPCGVAVPSGVTAPSDDKALLKQILQAIDELKKDLTEKIDAMGGRIDAIDARLKILEEEKKGDCLTFILSKSSFVFHTGTCYDLDFNHSTLCFLQQ